MSDTVKNVLICPVGQSYGVVTEALWCMLSASAERDPADPAAIIPDTVRVLTTQPGGKLGAPPDRARRTVDGEPMPAEILLADARDEAKQAGEMETDTESGPGAERLSAYRWLLKKKIDLLYRTFGHSPPDFTFEPAKDSRGIPLPDAFTAQQGADFEAAFLSLMVNSVSIDAHAGKQPTTAIDPMTMTRFNRDANTRMHVLMAGGRKYMASAARALVRDVAETGDKLWDVQVNPERIQYRGLWWPGHFHEGQATTEFQGKQIAGELRLVDYPFIPGNPTARSIREAHPSLTYRYAVQLAADAREGAPQISIDLNSRTIRCRDEELVAGETRVPSETSQTKFDDGHFLLLVVLFMIRKNGIGRFGKIGNDDAGWVTNYQGRDTRPRHHPEVAAFRELLEEISGWKIATDWGIEAQDAQEVFADAVKSQLNLAGSLPGFLSSRMSEILSVLRFHPYLQKRLRLEKTQLKVKLPADECDEREVKATAYRISAQPEDFQLTLNGDLI
ncbi:CRISPR-associated ring nuclease [Aliiruegeria sabulilitoris]|uniref:CRISPR-associated ring nuclease n=1 Tax=Aliiruegeria sabulilitoris TaxID=1510458 RepID=UPI0008365BC8|nr:CRISPR-associated ring nuclease [Aliiruegeria sabulilitoris]